jgi:hypothetical protein
VGLNSLKSLNLTNGYPNNKNKKKNNNKVKSKPLELRSRVTKTKKKVNPLSSSSLRVKRIPNFVILYSFNV